MHPCRDLLGAPVSIGRAVDNDASDALPSRHPLCERIVVRVSLGVSHVDAITDAVAGRVSFVNLNPDAVADALANRHADSIVV